MPDALVVTLQMSYLVGSWECITPELFRLKLGRHCLSKDQDAPDEEPQFDDGRNHSDGIRIAGHESWDARQKEQPEDDENSANIVGFVHHAASTSTIL
jgi:hypothetical protein